MVYNMAVVEVEVEHDGVVGNVREIVDELHEEEKFVVEIVSEDYCSEGSGVDGSKVLLVEVHEYVGECSLFIAMVDERVEGAEVVDVDVERGGSEIPAAVEAQNEKDLSR